MEKNTDKKKEEANGCGCLGVIVLIVSIVGIAYCSFDSSDFYLMPGEANQSMAALQKTFDSLDQILPDSLIITEELDPRNHYMSAESFGNLFYGLNPVLDAAAKADTSRKYKFQYIARVDHVDANEFVIRDFLVDSIWRHEPYRSDFESFFDTD